jgi:hypothetical protein
VTAVEVMRAAWAVLSVDSSTRNHCPVERELGLTILLPQNISGKNVHERQGQPLIGKHACCMPSDTSPKDARLQPNL